MTKLADKVNMIGGGMVSVLVHIFGPMWILFAGFLILNILDWFSGWRAAAMRKECNSVDGAKGIAKKVWYWMIIAVSFYIGLAMERLGVLLDIPLGFMEWIGWYVLSSYLVNEFRSILENMVRMNIYVPEFLIKGLRVTGEMLDGAAKLKFHKKNENSGKKS